MVGAGLATVVGAVVALFCPKADPRFLGLGLGLSAGVMIYISFVEILSIKAVEGFGDAGYSDAESKRYSTLLFFGGMLITFLLDILVHLLGFDHGHKCDEKCHEAGICQDPGYRVNLWLRRRCQACGARCGGGCMSWAKKEKGQAAEQSNEDLPRLEEAATGARETGRGASPAPAATSDATAAEEVAVPIPGGAMPLSSARGCCSGSPPSCAIPDGQTVGKAQGQELEKMGVMTAVAIGIHNFPEGLATFVAALADTSLGVAIAVAIAIHNVPEGLCVALPIYYSTGSRWRATLWAFLSGISEPIGGLIGWLVFAKSDLHPLAYGVMFSLVAGMMVFISLHELLPTALSYDPKNQFVTFSLVGGMVIMALSLLLFDI